MACGALLLGSMMACASEHDDVRHVAIIDASFGHCGPNWRCDGARLVQYLGALATLSGDVVIPYGRAGDHSQDFLNTAIAIADTKRLEHSESEPLDVVIIGMTGEAIANARDGADTVINNAQSALLHLQPYAARIIAIDYADIAPYNDYAERVGWPTVTPQQWDHWRNAYRTAMSAAGADVITVHDAWTAIPPGWHIDTSSSYRAALRLWASVLSSP